MTEKNWADQAEKDLEERELGWDDEITSDGFEFILLPEGIYNFEVDKFERGRYTPGPNSKLPPCNEAIITLKINHEGKTATLRDSLKLLSSLEWVLGQFFTSIGQKKKGEPLRMNWAQVPGSKGRVEVTQYTGNNGNVYNQIKRYLPPEENSAEQSTFTPGKF